MKFIIAICLIFTHYVCGNTCIVEKESALPITTIEKLRKFYKNTKSFTTAETPKINQQTRRTYYNKRFVKRYPKTQRLLAICLQSNITSATFYKQKTAKILQLNTHAFNRWLTHYLSLFAIFRV